MKKYLALALAVLMLLSAVSLAGCAAGTASSAAASAPAASSAAASAPAAASASASSAAPAAGGNLEESTKLLADAIANLKTTDNHQMMADPVLFDVPQATGTADELAKLPDTDSNKWHYYEYLDWDKGADANLPASPADGQKGKHIILIVHGAHAWTTCYTDAFKAACDAVGMTCDVYDPNWDQSTQDGYVDQAINEHPDAIVLIPISADHAEQQFKKITDAGIPAFCSNTTPQASAMNYILAYTGPNDWYQMRLAADKLGDKLGGKGGVAYITHNVGGSPYYARCYGPMTELAAKYPDIQHLDVQSPGFEASAVKQVVSDWITKYGDKLNGIVLADDSDQAIGAVEACKAAGRQDIVIMAAGISKQGAELIQSGDLMCASYQSCQGDAGLAVRTVSEYFCNQEIPRVSYIATDVITADNVDSFTPCQW